MSCFTRSLACHSTLAEDLIHPPRTTTAGNAATAEARRPDEYVVMQTTWDWVQGGLAPGRTQRSQWWEIEVAGIWEERPIIGPFQWKWRLHGSWSLEQGFGVPDSDKSHIRVQHSTLFGA